MRECTYRFRGRMRRKTIKTENRARRWEIMWGGNRIHNANLKAELWDKFFSPLN